MTLFEFMSDHSQEGKENKMYPCPSGFQTIGVGHNLETTPISDAAIEQIFKDDAQHFVNELRKIFPDCDLYDIGRRYALFAIIFTVGATGFMKFRTLILNVKAGDWNSAGDCMKRTLWYTQVKKRRGDIIINMLKTGKENDLL